MTIELSLKTKIQEAFEKMGVSLTLEQIVIERSKEKIHGKGFIYGVTFIVDIWTMLADKPLPQGIIEQIRMNLHVEGDGRVNRIVITPD